MSVPLRQLDDDVAAAVEAGLGTGRHQAGGVVFLDDEGPGARRAEVGAAEHRRLDPTVLGAEIGRTRRRRGRLGAAPAYLPPDARPPPEAPAPPPDPDQPPPPPPARA